jgi:sporulation protein YlmC with PRC-barrel domain
LVDVMVSVRELKGKDVYAKMGIKIGEIEDVELDSNWQVSALDVKMNDNVAKVLGEKAGFMQKKVVGLPATLLEPISADKITLNQIQDFDAIRNSIKTERSW